MKPFLFSTIVSVIFLATSCADRVHQGVASITNVQGVDIVSLYGTWEEMGEQYGALAGSHLRHVNDFLSGIIDGNTEKKDSILDISAKLFSRYPYSLKQFFKGMESSSGLTMEQLLMNNAIEYAEACFCSGIAAWSDYASSDLVFGRNYDAFSYGPVGEDIIVTVFHPSDGSLATATVGYAGEIYAVNAINAKGVFLELNNGMPSAGYDIDFGRFASTASLLEVMLDADGLDYLDAFFKTHRSFASFIIGVADAYEARSYEWCANGTADASGSTPEGLMVQTNHYVSPAWAYPNPSDENSWASITRRNNLLALAESYKGRIGEKTMCEIVSTPLEKGGAMNDATRYQLVFTPKTMRLLICIEQQPDWAEIDMKEFL